MLQTLLAIGVLGIVVGGLFLLVWVVDAKRAKDVENDEERLDVDTDATDVSDPTDPTRHAR